MTIEEKKLITTPDEIFYKLADEYEDMAAKCVRDINTILTHYFPNEDPRLIEAISQLISNRYNDDVVVIIDKFKEATLKTVKIGLGR